MFCTKIDIYGSHRYPLALGAIYEKIAEMYDLPSIELLLQSLEVEVALPDRTRGKLQVYYLENVTEQGEKALFQIRFAASREPRDLTSLFLSIEQSQVKNLSIQFPGQTGRASGSRVLSILKSAAHALQIGPSELDFEVQGFTEQGQSGYIREHSLSAFVWVDALERYLHIREDPTRVSEVRRGKKQL